jgi:hypothetical protein
MGQQVERRHAGVAQLLPKVAYRVPIDGWHIRSRQQILSRIESRRCVSNDGVAKGGDLVLIP